MLTLNKRQVLRDVIAHNTNRGFRNQVKGDEDLMLKYAIKKNLIRIDKDLGLPFMKAVIPPKDMDQWMKYWGDCLKYLSAKILFEIYHAGKINMIEEKVSRKRKTATKITVR